MGTENLLKADNRSGLQTYRYVCLIFLSILKCKTVVDGKF